VTPRAITPVHRRCVNFIGECHALITGSFFPLRRSLIGAAASWLGQLGGSATAGPTAGDVGARTR
jgi:hypothetical protein